MNRGQPPHKAQPSAATGRTKKEGADGEGLWNFFFFS